MTTATRSPKMTPADRLHGYVITRNAEDGDYELRADGDSHLIDSFATLFQARRGVAAEMAARAMVALDACDDVETLARVLALLEG
jgi:hypothetical protein